MQPFVTRRVTIPVTDDQTVKTSAPLRRVLFVSGDVELRAAVTRVLEDEHYSVHAVAHSGHALLHCLTKEIDVVVAELSGPDLSGPALVEQLRRHCPRLSPIFLGSPGTPEGVENVLVRPFTREDLLEHLDVAFHASAA